MGFVCCQAPIAGSASCPSLREKAILLVKLSQHVEKRFPDDTELNAQFLELVYFVYRYIAVDLTFNDDDDNVVAGCDTVIPPPQTLSSSLPSP